MAKECVEKIVINGIDYIPASQIQENFKDSPVKIVILQRGWVMVGRWSRDGEMCFLDNAKVIRQWGTKNGLGELVNGPLSQTILDDTGHVEFHILGVVATISCDAAKWNL